ncbi:MAG TPA: c-type cytochrome, partial [Burkholderiales bacterium]|nr:c-type cytochrome [Burkholderiales bacterium]
MKPFLAAAAAALAAAAVCASAFAGDAARGKQLYDSRCIGCHSIDENRVGPAHKGVFGRKAGLAPGYDYSPAVKHSKIVWNASTLNR